MKRMFLSMTALLAGLAACNDEPVGPELVPCDPVLAELRATLPGDTVRTASGLQFIEVEAGTGTPAQSGQLVRVHYSGYLLNGTRFDSSCPNQEPLQFVLGVTNLIPGFTEGVTGLRVGGVRRLIIPPALGYGQTPTGSIPANSTLIFDVELVSAGS